MKQNGLRCGTRKRKTMPKYRSQEELELAITLSLDTFLQKQGLPAKLITNINIVNFVSKSEDGKDVHKCGGSCMFCSKIIGAVHRGYWMTSNVTKHLKEHIKSANKTVEEECVVSI